jgi:hypothetical protein
MFFDDFFDDFGDLEDFAIVGGIAGFLEEECQVEAKERRMLEKESEPTEDPIEYDLFNPPEDDPYP